MQYMPPAPLRKTAATVLVCAFLAGTGGDTNLQYFLTRNDQGYKFVRVAYVSPASSRATALDIRSAFETLSRVREVFRLSISDLAMACGVSRQAVYKWISGSSASLARDNQSRLDDLYRAAELFAERGVTGSTALLKRKDKSGRTLLEALRLGESAQNWAGSILETLALESQQRAMLDARLRGRKRLDPDTPEWGVPMMNEGDA
jgi:transcriptional regulator with XRE-family HTH domain